MYLISIFTVQQFMWDEIGEDERYLMRPADGMKALNQYIIC